MSLVVDTGPARAADWPRLGGPEGGFVSAETGLLRSWPTNGPRLLWSVEVGVGFAGTAVWEGQVFLLDRPDNRQDLLRCFHLETGREEWRWSYPAPGSLPYPGSRNVPTVDADFIFVLGPFGHFHCLDRRRHGLLWDKHLVEDQGTEDGSGNATGQSGRTAGPGASAQVGHGPSPAALSRFGDRGSTNRKGRAGRLREINRQTSLAVRLFGPQLV